MGHCCLVVQTKELTILTDPGAFSDGQNAVTGIDVVLVTHEHADHLHIELLRTVLANNPNAQVITNSAVGKLLAEAGIAYTVLEGRDATDVHGVRVEAFDAKHEEIFGEMGQVQNTGYFIADTLFYPGDAYCEPGKPVEVLALPVAGPWCRVRDSIKYALAVKPARAFPVHDGMLQLGRYGTAHSAPQKVLAENGIDFVVLRDGEEKEF